MRTTHLAAEERYDALRKAALRAAKMLLPNSGSIDLRLVDFEALAAAKKWAASPSRFLDWDWAGGYRDFRFRHPKRFELAIWHESALVGLCLGRPTYHGGGLRLDFAEASPEGRAIQIMPIMLFAMTGYATAIGASEIRLVHPVNEQVRKYYESLGLTYVAKGDYLFRRL